MDKEEDRQISLEMGMSLAAAHDIELFETSAYTGYNINEMFERVANLIHIKQQQQVLKAKPAGTHTQGNSHWEVVNLNRNNQAGSFDYGHSSASLRKRDRCCNS